MQLQKRISRVGDLLAAACFAMLAVWVSLLLLNSGVAYADTQEANVSFQVAFDQKSYESGETACLTLTAINTSSEDMKNVTYEVTLPDSFDKINVQLTGIFDDMQAGDRRTKEILIPVLRAEPSPIVTVAADGNSTESKSASAGDLAATGDGSPLWVVLVCVLVCSAVVIFILQRKKKGAMHQAKIPSSMLSVLLVVCLTGILGVTNTVAAYASESKMSKEAWASCSVNGKSVEAGAVLSWTARSADGGNNSGGGDSGKDDEPGDRPGGIVYQDGVIVLNPDQASKFDADEVSAWIADGVDVAVGDIVVINPDPANGTDRGGVMRVTSIDDLEDGRAIRGEIPACNQVLKSINVEGTTNQVVSLEWAEGVYESPETASLLEAETRDSFGGNVLLKELAQEHKTDLDGFGTITASLDPSFEYALDYEWDTANPLPEVHKIKLGMETEAKLVYENESEPLEDDVPLGNVDFAIPGTPLFIAAQIELHVEAEGSVEVSVSTRVSSGFEYTDLLGMTPYIEASAYDVSAELNADAEAGLVPSLTLSFAGLFDLADVAVSAGYHVHGEMFVRDKTLTCSEIAGWVVVSLSAGNSGLLAELFDILGVEATWELLGEDDNPTRQGFHFENGDPVPECTWGQGGEGGDPEPPDPIDPGKPVEPVEPSAPSDDGAAGTLVAGRSLKLEILPNVNPVSLILFIDQYEASPDCIMAVTVVKDSVVQKELIAPGQKPAKIANLLNIAPESSITSYQFPALDPAEMVYPGYSDMHILIEVVKGSLKNMHMWPSGLEYVGMTWQDCPRYDTFEDAYQGLKEFDDEPGILSAGKSLKLAMLPGVNPASAALHIYEYEASSDCIMVVTVVKDSVVQKELVTPGQEPARIANLLCTAPESSVNSYRFPALEPSEMILYPGYSEMSILIEVVKGSLKNMNYWHPGLEFVEMTWQDCPRYDTFEDAYQGLKLC